ncbi:hypothetical protein H0H93_002245 [Arthromyces matolae]|nr:hypothetical protein H0H93_002245 [Arthromyces matolae]
MATFHADDQPLARDEMVASSPPSKDMSKVAASPGHQIHIPPEILCFIFELTTVGASIITVPPTLSHPVWVLGHVSSLWRRISRSIPEIWVVHILLQMYSTGANTFTLLALRNLFSRVKELLPACTRIVLRASHRPSVPKAEPIIMGTLDKMAPLIRDLTWDMAVDPTLFPRGIFSRLENLSIVEHNHNQMLLNLNDCFATSPKLQAFSIASFKIPDLIYFNHIPWSNLRSLCMDTTLHHKQLKSMIHSWHKFGKQNPICGLVSLRELSLKSHAKLFPVLLAIDFPWHQLSFLTIVWYDTPKNLFLLQSPLGRSVTLQKFTILCFSNLSTAGQLLPMPEGGDSANPLESLQDLRVGKNIPFIGVQSLILGGNLRTVQVDNGIYLQQFYSVIENCPWLSTFSSMLRPSTPIAADDASQEPASNLVLISPLTNLVINFQNDDYMSTTFPTRLVAPNLDSLNIRLLGNRGRFPLTFMCDLITRSNAKLSSICCFLRDAVLPDPPYSEYILQLMDSLSCATSVDMEGIVFPQSVLDLIASRELLPRVRTLNFGASSVDMVLSTIESRIQREAADGNRSLKCITVCIPDTTSMANAERFNKDLGKIEEEAGVIFNYHSLNIKSAF